MLELKDVIYGKILKIKQLTLGDEPLTLVVGPSGGGKTTFLRLLCNIIPCDGGSILFKGKDVLSIDPVAYRRRITMLSQASFVIDGSIKDNIHYITKLYNKKNPTDEEIQSALETVMLPKAPEEDTRNLSGGEKQRLCLCRALFLKPDILLLDEPASALDHDTAISVIGRFISKMNQNGTNIIMVSHSEDTVKQKAVRIVIDNKTAVREG